MSLFLLLPFRVPCLYFRRNLLFHHKIAAILPKCSNANTTSTSTSSRVAHATLYVGFTNNIHLRISQHRNKNPGSHTAKYNIGRLVHYERFTYVLNAIAREKELKGCNRSKKAALIEQSNPTWEDLASDW